jgi:hypothetical protein
LGLIQQLHNDELIADKEISCKLLAMFANSFTTSEINALKPLLRNSIFVESLNEGGFLYRDSWSGSEIISRLQLTTSESLIRVIRKLQAKSSRFAGDPYQQLWACKT